MNFEHVHNGVHNNFEYLSECCIFCTLYMSLFVSVDFLVLRFFTQEGTLGTESSLNLAIVACE